MWCAVLLAAQLAGRPTGVVGSVDCPEPLGSSRNAWERAKAPLHGQYCDLVAGAASKLASNTEASAGAALDAILEAERIEPGHAATLALKGRALAALGKIDEALTAMRGAKALDERSVDEPHTLRDLARLLALKGKADEALEAYRALLPRMTTFASLERSTVALEAALVALARGPTFVDEALAASRRAMHSSTQSDVRDLAVLALALAQDRGGHLEEARATLAERFHGDPRSAVAGKRSKQILSVAATEVPALVGFALESSDPVGADDAWGAYLDGSPQGPWAAHARAHLRVVRVRQHGRWP